MPKSSIRVAIIDMNNNTPNESMRCLRQMLANEEQRMHLPIELEVFDARYKTEMPGTDFDIYLSSGGPGSPFDGEGSEWERLYFNLLDQLWHINTSNAEQKKYVFFICHSFQLMCRFFQIGHITQRPYMAFGVNPIRKTAAGEADWLLGELANPFYAADFRNFQVIEPTQAQVVGAGATLLAEEVLEAGEAPRPLALTALRVGPEMVGTQFHPEADAPGMVLHFQKPEKKSMVIERYGEEKYHDMIAHFQDPDKIELTHRTIIPAFLHDAAQRIAAK